MVFTYVHHYWNLHLLALQDNPSNRFFNSVRTTTVEKQKAGRLLEILQEQLKPIFLVFIAGWIDAVFNVTGVILFFLRRMHASELYIQDSLYTYMSSFQSCCGVCSA